ncbi:MAG: hypothetical protein M3167_14500 [Acidobacteriota bacterium]|nr:hypothetical protein [Acidobacteriota bacterium]
MTICLRRASLAAALALASGSGALLAQPAVHLETGGKEWVTARTPIELVVVSPPTAEDGRLAFLLLSPDGSSAVDATDLFRATERGYIYRAELAPLPSGEHDLAVYLVTPAGQWGEFTRVHLRVLKAGGFESATAVPRLDVTAEGRIAGSGTQTSLSPALTRDKLNLQLDLQGAFVRNGWTLAPRVNIIGASLQNEAIRFGQLGNAAPQVDLSQYAIGLTHGGFSLQIGTVIYGTERHLLFGFLSRGVQVRAPLGGGVDVSLVAMNGTPIVGWDNPSGLQQDENRIFAGTLGVELFPNRPGGLRIEALYVDGSQKPFVGFNQGAIVDAQKSQGAGLHLLASTPSNRIRLDAGWSVSRFENPSDPLLSQGNTLVPVEPERRQAHYVDLFLDLLQRQTKAGLPMNVSLILRHSRVDPQYRTVGSFFQADREEDGAEANLFLGSIGAHAIYALAEDNLDHIPSILTTKTRRAAANVAAPLSQLFARSGIPRAWLPTASYTVDRTHQFGTKVPENGEFTPSFVPDQVSTTQTAALDWFVARARGGIRYGRSHQDNRQPGREAADFVVNTYGVNVGVNAARGLDVGLDAIREEAESLEFGQQTRTMRYGMNLIWNLSPAIAMSALASRSESAQNPRAREVELWNADAQIGWRFERRRNLHGWGGRLFLRYLLQSIDTRVFPQEAPPRQHVWRINGGLSLNLF